MCPWTSPKTHQNLKVFRGKLDISSDQPSGLEVSFDNSNNRNGEYAIPQFPFTGWLAAARIAIAHR